MSVRLLTGMIAMAFAFTSASVPAAMVSVRVHGAKGDGKADDRAAIQAAIDAVDEAGGGVVHFPEGVYRITAPNKGHWAPQVELCNRLELRGVGMRRSVVRVADSQGAYDAIFAGKAIEGFSMTDLGIDANGTANPVVTEKDSVPSPYRHTLVYLPQAKDVAIQRCRFTNLSGVFGHCNALATHGGHRDIVELRSDHHSCGSSETWMRVACTLVRCRASLRRLRLSA